MRTLEAVLEKQISSLDDAGARAQVRSDTIAARLNQESARIESLGDHLTEAAGRAGEVVAGRAAQLKATMELAEGTLKMAAQSLDVQAAGFRAAVTMAAETPLEAAKSLEAQSSRIQDVADAAMARAEFVLARHEKHRAQMSELVEKLKSESEVLKPPCRSSAAGMENAIQALGGEARRFETVTGDAERHLEQIMANAATRAGQLSDAFTREAERLKETSEAAAQLLAGLAAAIKEAGDGARTLIGESSAQAKQDARASGGRGDGGMRKAVARIRRNERRGRQDQKPAFGSHQGCGKTSDPSAGPGAGRSAPRAPDHGHRDRTDAGLVGPHHGHAACARDRQGGGARRRAAGETARRTRSRRPERPGAQTHRAQGRGQAARVAMARTGK